MTPLGEFLESLALLLLSIAAISTTWALRNLIRAVVYLNASHQALIRALAFERDGDEDNLTGQGT